MYRRFLLPVIEELMTEFRVVYLTGPRQAGKTTLVRELAEKLNLAYFTLDDPAVRAAIDSDPHGFVRSLEKKPVALDEFQYTPELIPAIKEASDNLLPKETGRFLLTGSADIFRSARTQEALPGHMARLELYPLAQCEIHGSQNNLIDVILSADYHRLPAASFITREALAQIVLNGGYPEVLGKSPRAKQIWFKSYMEGRLYKDFESLHAARGDYHSKLEAMLPWLAGRCGNLLKYASAANDLDLNDKVIKQYIEILELMFIVQRVPAWLKNSAKRQAIRMPKLQYVDTGLACHLLGLRTPESLLTSQFYGGLLENLVYLEISKQAGWATEDISLYHYRDTRKHEVDIVMERDNGKIIGMEVKASATVRADDFRGLVKLAEAAGPRLQSGILIYTGEKVLPFTVGTFHFHALPISALFGVMAAEN